MVTIRSIVKFEAWCLFTSSVIAHYTRTITIVYVLGHITERSNAISGILAALVAFVLLHYLKYSNVRKWLLSHTTYIIILADFFDGITELFIFVSPITKLLGDAIFGIIIGEFICMVFRERQAVILTDPNDRVLWETLIAKVRKGGLLIGCILVVIYPIDVWHAALLSMGGSFLSMGLDLYAISLMDKYIASHDLTIEVRSTL